MFLLDLLIKNIINVSIFATFYVPNIIMIGYS